MHARDLPPGPAAFPKRGLCVQAYLYRTAKDLEPLIALGSGVRLVKGAYKEPPDRAFPKKSDVDENYLPARRTAAFGRGAHEGRPGDLRDPRCRVLIARIEELARSAKLPPQALEFQMLYGIGRQQQLRLAAAGYRFRVLISYGDAWFPWYMRRLAERPANVLFVLKSTFAR